MSISVNPSYCHCATRGIAVSLEQTEGQCRERHNCGDDPCPLEQEFGQDRYNRALNLLVPNLRSGWADDQK